MDPTATSIAADRSRTQARRPQQPRRPQQTRQAQLPQQAHPAQQEAKASWTTRRRRRPHRTCRTASLSWLAFNERVLDQGADETVPLLERLNFISIFWSNLQEFFMVRVGSLTDLALVKKHIIDSKSGMTPSEQLAAIYGRCRELYPHLRAHLRNAARPFAKGRRLPPPPRRPGRRATRLPARPRGPKRPAVPVAADHQRAPPLPPPRERGAVRGGAPGRAGRGGRRRQGRARRGRRQGQGQGQGRQRRQGREGRRQRQVGKGQGRARGQRQRQARQGRQGRQGRPHRKGGRQAGEEPRRTSAPRACRWGWCPCRASASASSPCPATACSSSCSNTPSKWRRPRYSPCTRSSTPTWSASPATPTSTPRRAPTSRTRTTAST